MCGQLVSTEHTLFTTRRHRQLRNLLCICDSPHGIDHSARTLLNGCKTIKRSSRLPSVLSPLSLACWCSSSVGVSWSGVVSRMCAAWTRRSGCANAAADLPPRPMVVSCRCLAKFLCGALARVRFFAAIGRGDVCMRASEQPERNRVTGGDDMEKGFYGKMNAVRVPPPGLTLAAVCGRDKRGVLGRAS